MLKKLRSDSVKEITEKMIILGISPIAVYETHMIDQIINTEYNSYLIMCGSIQL